MYQKAVVGRLLLESNTDYVAIIYQLSDEYLRNL